MKPILSIANIVLAVVLILILLSSGLPNYSVQAAAQTPTATADPDHQAQSACDPQRSVNVSGTAIVNILPDRALLQLGVQSNGKTPREVQAQNAESIRGVIEALTRLGIQVRDISTDRYVIEPLYEDYDSLRIKGYRIHNIVAVTLRDVDQTSDVIAAAFEAGANQVVDVEFYTNELRKYRDQAREMAMQAASEKANALAQAAGAETDCVLTISENSSSYFNGWSWWYGSNNPNLWTQNSVQNARPSASEPAAREDTPVNPGQISIRAEVSVTFSLK